jgi:hypothetical protein
MKTVTSLVIILGTVLASCAPISIIAPTATATPDLSHIPADIPIHPEHVNFMDLSSAYINDYSYGVYADLQTVVQFYQTEMVEQGWDQIREPLTYDTEVILHYVKDDREAIIDIGYRNGRTAVGFSVGPRWSY